MAQTIANVATGFLTGVVRSIVEKPDEVSVSAAHAPEVVALTLRVAQEDLEVVVGPSGRTVRSLETVVAALGRRSGLRISLDIKVAYK